MRFGQTALLGGLSLLLVGPAQAGGWTESCDWFENSIVGSRCAQLVVQHGAQLRLVQLQVKLRLERREQELTNNFPKLPAWVTPTSWLTLSYTSEYGFDNHSWTFSDGSYGSRGPLSSPYRQISGGNVNVNRYRLPVLALRRQRVRRGICRLDDGYEEQTGVFGGLVANGQWRLGSSGSRRKRYILRRCAAGCFPEGEVLALKDVTVAQRLGDLLWFAEVLG